MTNDQRDSPPRLGSAQAAMLKRMVTGGDRMATWYPGCGWLWDTVSGTKRVMDGLAAKGFVERAEETITVHGGHTRTETVYRLTAAGRTWKGKRDDEQ